MKRALPVLASFTAAALVGAFIAVVTVPRPAEAQRLVMALEQDFYDCDGGVTHVVPDGRYVVSFKDEVVWECVGDAGCVTGGQFFSPGVSMSQTFASGGVGTPVSCRSAGLTGDMVMTLLGPGNP